MRPETPRRGRVAESHDIARSALVSALLFAVIAIGWSVYVLIAGGSWWGPLHSFAAGTVLLSISGASQMFTITWSSTVPPNRAKVSTQRWLLIAGVGAVLVGVTTRIPSLVLAGGLAAAIGLILLGWILYSAVRKSLLGRFDLSARFYLTALAAGAVGVTLGTIMGADPGTSSDATVRLVHAHLNLVGLVGLTIVGTIPTLLPTTAYSPAVSGREALVAWWVSTAAVVLIAAGLRVPELVGLGTIAVAFAAALILGEILRRLWKKGARRLAFLQITVGSLWLIGWALVDGVVVVSGGTVRPFSGWTGAVVLTGVGQVLVGSLAYLVPVLKGSPLEANREIMERAPWLPLAVLNAAGLCLGVGLSAVAVALSTVWVMDFGLRLTRVSRARNPDR